MRHNGTRSLFDYWNGLRGKRSAPARAEIAPAALGKTLANLFVLERERRATLFRFAGTWLGTPFGGEPTGTEFAAFFDRDDRALVDQLVAAVSSEHVVAVADLAGDAGPGRSIDMEMIILPLADNPARLLGAIHPYTSPFWLGAEPMHPPELTSVRILDVEKELFALGNRPPLSLVPQRQARSFGRRHNLRVIDGDQALAAHAESEAKGRPIHELRVIDGGLTPADNG